MQLGDHKVYVKHHFTVVETTDTKKARCKTCKEMIANTPIHWCADKPASLYKMIFRFCSDDCIDTWEFNWLEKRANRDHPWQH